MEQDQNAKTLFIEAHESPSEKGTPAGAPQTAATLSRADKRWLFWMEFCAKYAGCHQMPERSFFIKGFQFPICARCTGILIGYIVALLVNPFVVMPWWIPVLMVPMAVDGTVQLLTKYESNQFLRVTTGLLFGYAAVSTLFTYIRLIIDFCIRRWG